MFLVQQKEEKKISTNLNEKQQDKWIKTVNNFFNFFCVHQPVHNIIFFFPTGLTFWSTEGNIKKK